MYLLYLDESGNPDDPADRYFVLGGAAIFESRTASIAQSLEEIQTRHFPGSPPIEFHATDIRNGRGFWRSVDVARRNAVLREIGAVIANALRPGLVLFAAAVEKDERRYGEAAVKIAMEDICKRFDTFLKRRYTDNDDPQRGLLVLAEGRFHQRSRPWVQEFRSLGTQWGVLRNLSDIPYFASTKETRLLQVADFVAHSVYLLYERRDSNLARAIMPRFDQRDGIIHGLAHIAERRGGCTCPACNSRRNLTGFGPWVDEPEAVGGLAQPDCG